MIVWYSVTHSKGREKVLKTYALMITDLHNPDTMPVMQGWEISQELKDRIVAQLGPPSATGIADRAAIEELIEQGPNAVFVTVNHNEVL